MFDKFNINTELFYLSGKEERRKTLFLEVVCKKCGNKRFVVRYRLNSIKRCLKCHNLGDLYERISNRYSISKSGCYEWTSYLSKDGYAKIRYKGKALRVAKIVLEKKLKRKIKEGYETCHNCNNRKCLNPEHLYEGTHKQNGEDLSKAGSLNGEKSSSVKITENTAIQIKIMLKEEMAIIDIANKLNISRTIIENIKYGLSWKWLKI